LKNVYDVTEAFERELARYTGAPYVATVDNMSNALFLALMYEQVGGLSITLPKHTYPSVPCEVIHAGATVHWEDSPKKLKGAYRLQPTNVWDSALRFTHNMYTPGQHMCVSFTGPYKTLKLSKGGAILTDNKDAYEWFKRARYSGRRPISYHEDRFDMLGWNFYLMPELATRGLLMMSQFYDEAGQPIDQPDLERSYPDLSKYPVYTCKR
jgi:dTDP-4-amino-4,6-dideoxygalactose transaminase